MSGFGKGEKFFVSECAASVDANAAGCGLQLAAQPFGLTNSSGQGSLTFRVSSTAATKPYNTITTRTCSTTGCVLVATAGIGSGYGAVPLSFANG